jgi:hypothetical protein
VKKIKAWPDFKAAWDEGSEAVTALKTEYPSGSGGPLDFLVPVEVLIPSDAEDPIAMEAFTSSLFEVCAARNNNRQLADEAKANKKGLYDELRKHVPSHIEKRVEWKSNDGGDIKVRDLVAFSWVPISAVELPSGVSAPRPADIYSGKGKCSTAFDALMEHPDTSTKTADGTHELHNTVIGSALAIAGTIPDLIDKIYEEFPLAYNRTGGNFGLLRAVTLAKDLRTKPTTPFGKKLTGYRYPDGFIVPLVFGLKALLETDAFGNLQWKVEPSMFLYQHLDEIVRKYKVLIQAFGGDAQKIGKNEGSYSLAYDAFETELLKRAQAA